MMTAPTLVRTDEELLHWLALRLAPGLGARKAVDLIERFGSPVPLFRASSRELEACGLSGAAARSISSGCSFEDAAAQLEKLRSSGCRLLPYNDPAYPQRLREIYDPPLLLFLRGRQELLSGVSVGIVGSRRASPYGLAVAEKLGRDLAALGLTVSSGMARGIDTAAHRGALEATGATVAVFGCGLDIIYPAENRRLADAIAERGLLVSEYPFSSPAYPQNFPVRNRIISGISAGIVVVEGAQYSGSLVTARLALDQNREVYAVPGNITSSHSFGPNLLIKQGAHLVQCATDVVDNLNLDDRRVLIRADVGQAGESQTGFQASLPLEGEVAGLSPAAAQLARQVLHLLTLDSPTPIDRLVAELDSSSPSEIIAALFELELAGLIRQLAGRNYVKVWTG